MAVIANQGGDDNGELEPLPRLFQRNFSPARLAERRAAIASATQKIIDKAQLLAGAALGTDPASLTWIKGAWVDREGDGAQPQTIADVAMYAHGSGALPPGVEGGLDAQTVYRD